MSNQPERVLYQFKGSQFAEKARWALDHKGLADREQALLA